MTIVTVNTAATPLTPAMFAVLDEAWATWRTASSSNEEGVYEAAHRALRTALAAAYGADADAVYDVILDSYETAPYAANVVVTNRAAEARSNAGEAYEQAAWSAMLTDLTDRFPEPLTRHDAACVAAELWEDSRVAWEAYRATDLIITWDDFTQPLPEHTHRAPVTAYGPAVAAVPVSL